MIRRVLIANRGEIAVRLARTCRSMGIATVAVFSDADEGAPHVLACDQAVRLGPAPARDSYLAIDRVVAAARATGCDAVHPGYGFLSENADFARACGDAGLIFIGPTPEVIHTLGSKERARELARQAGVPVLEGHRADDEAVARLPYPLLLKASAGGGGKGMRVVRDPAELAAALDSARREALGAFGDDTILVERYLEGARHVELQILGDQHGNLVHLFERECTIQRRHQKILEETPSPALDAPLRQAMASAALAVARAVGYTSAGTVEMLLAPDRSFYFLEVNTRLQVEHAVTEMVTGLDLVREQIRIASGEALWFRQEDVRQQGHAIEVRLYAEDPEQDFLPAAGTLIDWAAPTLPEVRVDSGVASGVAISTHYDPLLAKIVCHAATREEAAARLARALEELVALGTTTNRELLIALLRHPELLAGRLDTHFLERHRGDLFGRPVDSAAVERAAIAAALAGVAARAEARPVLPSIAPGWRNNPGVPVATRFRRGEQEVTVQVNAHGERRFTCRVGDREHAVRLIERATLHPAAVQLRIEDDQGVQRAFRVASAAGGAVLHVHADGRDHTFVEEPRFPDRARTDAVGGLHAPMPSRVVKVLVAEGDVRAAGQPLIMLEAMKMEHAVRAIHAGRVRRMFVSEGDPVDMGAPLVALDPLE